MTDVGDVTLEPSQNLVHGLLEEVNESPSITGDTDEKQIEEPLEDGETLDTEQPSEDVPLQLTDENVAVSEAVTSTSEPAFDELEQRSFSLKGIRHPGSWKVHPELNHLLENSESFQIKFDAAEQYKGPKSGTVSLIFPSVSAARTAYATAEKLKIDGIAITVVAANAFYLPASLSSQPYFTPSMDDNVRSRTVYVLNLRSTDETIVDSILGSDIEKVSFLAMNNDMQQAEGIMTSAEAAQSARQDANGMELEDGRQCYVVRICTTDEYETLIAEETALRPFVPSRAAAGQEAGSLKVQPARIEGLIAPEIDEDDVAETFLKYVEDNKVNWAELEGKDELYEMCDAVSGMFGGVPDSILKPAMLKTLQRHLAMDDSPSGWMKQHLQMLIEQWKREVMSEVQFVRESQVQMHAPDYVPVPETRKRKLAESTRSGRIKMGVGAFLQSARTTFRTENGDFEVDEDDSGNFMIGGEELSFESWGKLTKTKQPEVFSMNMLGEKKNKDKPIKKPPVIHDYQAYRKEQKERREKQMGYKKMKLMKKDRDEMEALEKAEREAAEAAVAQATSAESSRAAELDEGEIDSEEERKQAAKKKKKNSSSSSSSSSDSDDSEEGADARGRRRRRRKRETQTRSKKQDPETFPQLYVHRLCLVQALPDSLKAAFVNMLREVKASGNV